MKKIILLSLTILAFTVTNAQHLPPIACPVTGQNPVNYNDVWTYTLSSSCSASGWTCSCGTVLDWTSNTVDIQFNGSGCSSALIRATGTTGSITVTIYPPIVAGSISPSSQTINYNTTPSTMTLSGVSGGSGTYTYQWYTNTSGTYQPISGATSTSYTPGNLTATTSYEVKVSSNGASATTSPATVTVYPQLVAGSISPSSQTINYNTAPSTMSLSGVSGGSGTYTYQWYTNATGSYQPITGATSTSYTAGNMTSTTSYEVKVTSNGVTATTSPVTVTVYPQVVAGTISPSTQNINYNTTPSSLSISACSGGNGTYSYQWQSSPNSSFTSPTNVGTNATSYSPPQLTSTTYYRVGVSSNGSSAVYSSSAVVNVYPQLVSGTISPSSQTINYNTTPSTMTISGTSGGNLSYSYQWYTNAGGTYQSISGATSASYTPGILASTTSYEVVTTSNGVNVTSPSATVTVNPQVLPGSITPSWMVIASGASPGTLTASPASGGACGSFGYQWQSAPDNSTWSTVSGATNLIYSAGTLSSSIYYRVQVICGTDTEYTASAEISVGSADSDLNYIRTRTLSKAGVTDTVTADGLTSPFDVSQTTQYYDGLGRAVQTVAMQETPLQKDLVLPEVYDLFGRESTKYMPYAASTSDGNFKYTALSDQFTFNSTQFSGEDYYYSGTTYEASMLNRPLESDAPGSSWIGSGRGVTVQYLINTLSDSVQIWSIGSQQLSLPVDNGAYAAGQLFKTVQADENGNQMVVYKDKMGKTILRKLQASPSPSSGHYGWRCTYYVYDTLQNLRFVIQPQAVAVVNGSWSVSQTIANELCFRYEYNGRKQMVLKKTPGAGAVITVYDARNRPVMQQDSSLRGAEKWLFIKYDAENRSDSTGLISDPSNYNNPAYHDSLAYYSINYPSVGSYTNELLTQNFYDDYSWVSTYSAPVSSTMATNDTGNSSYFITTYNTSPTYAVAITPFAITRGMPTGSMKKVIGSASQYLYTANFYDDRERAIQTQSVNYTGGIDTITMQYNFSGSLLRTLLGHKKNGNTTQNHIVLTKMDYDQSMRLRHVWKNIDGAASDQLIDSMQYNELGQIRAKWLGNNLDSLIYDYNVRGWLTGINKNYVAGATNQYFGMELGYDKSNSAAPGNSYITQEYNGNIEGAVWKSAGSGINRKYDYTYDNASRLTSAAFLQNTTGTSWDNSQVDLTVGNLTYDANGNILTMEQKGFLVGGSQFIDQLKYTYQSNSNKLIQVYDTANNPSTLLGDFHWSGTKQDTDYYYDGNGNRIQDNNRAISSVTYNYLNLPQQVHMNGKGNITYTYDAGGTRLSKVIADSVSMHSTTILYIGPFVYQQRDTITNAGGGTDTLQFIAHEEGRARWAYHKYTTGTTAYKLEYDFFEKDYQGNTRMVLTQERDTSNYLASMEAAYRSTESQLFANIASTSYAWSSVPGNSSIPSGTKLLYTNPNDSVSKVDYTGSGGQTTGPSLLLKVMSGDTINMAVQAYYNTNTDTTTNSSFNSVLNSLASALVNTATGGAEGTLSGFKSSSSPVYSALSSFLPSKDPAPPSGYPKAY